MASFTHDGGNKFRIQVGTGPQRKTVRYRGPRRDAERFCEKVERLYATQGDEPADVLQWLAELPDKLHERLVRAGLAKSRAKVQDVTLGTFMDKFFAAMTLKPATRTFYGHTRRNLEDVFGKDFPVRAISPADADTWRVCLVDKEKLAPATVARRVIAARTMWHKAIRWGLVDGNPFTGVKSGNQVNESRKFYVSHETIEQVIDEAPDTEWKAIIALSRYAGIRVPSELYSLRWADVDLERGRMTVTSSKTEHHAGGGSRVVPVFAELRPHLEALFAQSAAEGAVYVVTEHRQGAMNLRTDLQRIIKRAGVAPWPKLFHNLRASRESELMREYDLATVCRWIGNSPAIAAKHYATSVDLDADFRRASGVTEKTAHKAAQHGKQSSAVESKQKSGEGRERSENATDYIPLPSAASAGVGDEGPELSANSKGNTEGSSGRGALPGASDVAELAAALSRLSPEQRAALLRSVTQNK